MEGRGERRLGGEAPLPVRAAARLPKHAPDGRFILSRWEDISGSDCIYPLETDFITYYIVI